VSKSLKQPNEKINKNDPTEPSMHIQDTMLDGAERWVSAS